MSRIYDVAECPSIAAMISGRNLAADDFGNDVPVV
jgi:hypothetical protein